MSPNAPERVLIVDDHVGLSRILERTLERWGFAPLVVATLRQAEREVERSRPALVLLDVGLPDGSGLDFLAFLRTRAPEVDAIIMTGSEDLVLAARAMSEGAIEFLPKPFELEALERILGSWRERSRAEAEKPPASAIPGGEEEDGSVAWGHALIGRHPTMIDLFKRVGLAAVGREPVLIRGETGTGKELVARTIHRLSSPELPFLAVNCAALPDSLLEAELFGHVRGAFTGALASRKGRFELAGRGTLLLDEIGDTSPAFQAKILRVIQEERFTPVGAEASRPMQARIVAATHRDLESMLEQGTFRSDLYYRIRVIDLVLPPLRDRRVDIPDLARHIAHRAAARSGSPAPTFTSEGIRALRSHPWPGNVRELENVVRRAIALGGGHRIGPAELGLPHPDPLDAPGPGGTGGEEPLSEVVLRHAADVLERSGGNKREAARRLDISPGRLYRILEGEGVSG